VIGMIDRLHIDRVRSGFTGELITDVAPQRCSHCGDTIPPGMFFTRRTLSATGATHLICERCQPFRLIDLPISVERGVTRHLGA
jgi:hypothetical protein